MQRNIVEYLEQAARLWPEKTVYKDKDNSVTFAGVKDMSDRIASLLCAKVPQGSPVIVFAAKSVYVASMYLGVAQAGCFYIPLDADLPVHRLRIIFETIKPDFVLTDGEFTLPDELNYNGNILTLDECLKAETDSAMLRNRREKWRDTDPLYVLFTSGSSGTPKGVVTSHRNVIDYIDVFAETFGICNSDIFGNQAPLDYVAALRDLYLPLRTGAMTVLFDKSLFSMPKILFNEINLNKCTILCWVASAFSLCAELGVFSEIKLETVNKVFFTGSVFPCRHLKIWQENLPGTVFVNHYGPTEITASCTYYKTEHKVSDDETIPIGIPFRNTGILLLDQDGKIIGEDNKMGEICVCGAGVVPGYFRDSKKTEEAFVINPAQPYINEIMYKTGDLGCRLPDGNYTFHGRLDSQIKHMGHRIELPEIEAAALSLPGLDSVCCLYKPEKEMIWMFYSGSVTKKDLAGHLRKRLPGYMVPRKFVYVEDMPRTQSGKIDSNKLKKSMN
ncbi:MAG: AMP-binding protein [Oscillospiraceae bacterium]|nr:AMP-binding protein [Oscillospiraceae bacterium]